MDDFLDSALAVATSSTSRPVGEDPDLVQRMQQALVEKHQERLAELQRSVEEQGAELEELSETFREGGGPPVGWQPQCTPGVERDRLDEEDERESEEDEQEDDPEVQLHRLLEQPRWKM